MSACLLGQYPLWTHPLPSFLCLQCHGTNQGREGSQGGLGRTEAALLSGEVRGPVGGARCHIDPVWCGYHRKKAGIVASLALII